MTAAGEWLPRDGADLSLAAGAIARGLSDAGEAYRARTLALLVDQADVEPVQRADLGPWDD